MVSIYVNPEIGDDLNTGTENSPVKHLFRARWQAVSGDEIISYGSSFENPYREGIGTVNGVAHRCALLAENGITIRAKTLTTLWNLMSPEKTNGDRVHISAFANISQNQIYEWPDHRTGFHDNLVNGWNGTSTFVQTNNLWGDNLKGCRSIANGHDINKTILLYGKRKIRLRIAYQSDISVPYGMFRQNIVGVPGITDGVYSYNFDTKKWSTPTNRNFTFSSISIANDNNFVEGITDWFCLPDGPEDIESEPSGIIPTTTITTNTGNPLLIQWIITEALAEWEFTGNDVYKLPFHGGSRDLSYFGRVSPYHSDKQVTGIYFCPSGQENDWRSYRISEGNSTITPPTQNLCSFFTSNGEPRIEFKVPPGKLITDYSIFMSMAPCGARIDKTTTGFVWKDIDICGAQTAGITENTAGGLIERWRDFISLVAGFCYIDKPTTKIRLMASYQPYRDKTYAKLYGGGLQVGQSGSNVPTTSDIQGYFVYQAGDDGAQPIGGGRLKITGYCCVYPAGTGIELSATMDSGGEQHIHDIHGVTIWGAGLNAIRQENDRAITVNMSNVVTGGSENSSDFEAAGGANPINIQNSIWNFSGTISAESIGGSGYIAGGALKKSWDANIAIQSFSSLKIDINTMELMKNSPLIDTGIKWWSGNNPLSANGRIYNNKPDVGGSQSEYEFVYIQAVWNLNYRHFK